MKSKQAVKKRIAQKKAKRAGRKGRSELPPGSALSGRRREEGWGAGIKEPERSAAQLEADLLGDVLDKLWKKNEEQEQRWALAYLDQHGMCAFCRVEAGVVLVVGHITEVEPRP